MSDLYCGTICVLPLLASCVGPDLFADCRYEEHLEAILESAGVEEVVVRASAGDLTILGSPEASRIEARGHACAARERDLRRIQLLTSVEAGRASIEVDLGGDTTWRRSWLDLELTLPSHLPLSVDDSSGDVHVSGVAGLELSDGSGDIFVHSANGGLRIEDGSGDIEIEGAAGKVVIADDGSGDVRIVGAAAIEIHDDGSGDITIEDVTGDVVIRDDGSGDIVVRALGGDLRVGDSGSGDLRFSDVRGRIDID